MESSKDRQIYQLVQAVAKQVIEVLKHQKVEILGAEVITIQGKQGDPGKTPVKGKDYFDGKDGLSIKTATVNKKGELVLTFTDKTSINVGKVMGDNGKDAEYSEEALVKKILALLPPPQYIDEGDLEDRIAEKLQKILKPERIDIPKLIKLAIKELKKELRYEDLIDKPDLARMIYEHTKHLSERRAIIAPGASNYVTRDQVAEIVASLGGSGGGTWRTETVTGVIDGSNTVFTLPHTPVSPNSVILSLARQIQIQGVDYTVSGDQITYTVAPDGSLDGQPHVATYQ